MDENNKVGVRIYGQEYTIAGSASREQMETVASHVDRIMNQLAKGSPSLSTLSLAVLTAVNVTSDYYESLEKNRQFDEQIAELKKETDRYIQLWEEARAGFHRYKADAENSSGQLQKLQRIFNLKNVELNQAKASLEEMTQKYEELKEASKDTSAPRTKDRKLQEKYNALKAEYDKLAAELAEAREAAESADSAEGESTSQGMAELEEKYKELENSFFDIQMENINLKNEIDALQKSE